jgi:hypothetical protein
MLLSLLFSSLLLLQLTTLVLIIINVRARVCVCVCVLQELSDWNARYRHKFGFIFLICASGRSTAEILADLKVPFILLYIYIYIYIYVKFFKFSYVTGELFKKSTSP